MDSREGIASFVERRPADSRAGNPQPVDAVDDGVVPVMLVDELVVVAPAPGVEVVLPEVDVVVDDDGAVAVVEVEVDVEVEVLVVVAGGGSVVGGSRRSSRRWRPLPLWPKMSANGRPAMSSITVTKRRETTKTTTTRPTICGHGRVVRGVATGPDTTTVASSRSAPVVSVAAVAAALVAGASCTAEAGDGSALTTPHAFVPPNRRRMPLSGARTTACLTALFVRSIDWKTRTVPVVAAREPSATPTMVPFTPKMEAMTADNTAPAAEARI